MKLIIQDVDSAWVKVLDENGNIKREEKINRGAVIYFSVSKEDCSSDAWENRIDKFVDKFSRMRFLKDQEGKLNATLSEIKWELIVISNFILYWQNKKWTKIDFSLSGWYEKSKEIYNYFINKLGNWWIITKTWEFWAMMKVESINNGPINYILEF